MTAPATTVVRYEFTYVTVDTGLSSSFALGGITDEVARAIRTGLEGEPTINAVKATQVLEYREEVELPPGPGGPVAFEAASDVLVADAAPTGGWHHDTTNGGGLLVWAVFNPDPNDAVVTDYALTCDGVAMTSMGQIVEPTNHFWIEAFTAIVDPGTRMLAWEFPSQPNMHVRAQSLSYVNATGFTAFTGATGSDKSPHVTVDSAANRMTSAMFAWDGSPVSGYSLPTQTERGNAVPASMPGVESQDAAGALSVPFGLTLVSKTGWATAGIDVF